MAKGNMFQGQARGSVGDVVFYRMDNMQIARVRNRKPQNPKTQRQMAQRAIMSTIMQAYSHGKEIFDHSFEGKKVPMGSMREFLSRNANALRQALIYDFDVKSTTHVNAIVNAPKTNSPQPNQYVVSAGSLQNVMFAITDASQQTPTASVSVPSALDGETMREYAQRVGLHVGDIYTIVGFALNTSKTIFSTPNGIGAGAYQEQGQFFFLRLIVTDGIESDELANSKNFTDIFVEDATQGIDKLGPSTIPFAGYTGNLSELVHFSDEGWVPVSMGIIRSELNSGLRSNETLHWCKWNNAYGINWANLYLAWDKSVDALGNSDLILEGANFGNEIILSEGTFGELKAVGNFLGLTNDAGQDMILTSGGNAIVLSSGKIEFNVTGNASNQIAFKNTGTYSGSLATQEATITQNRDTEMPGSMWAGTLTLKSGDITLNTQRIEQTIGGVSDTPLTVAVNEFTL